MTHRRAFLTQLASLAGVTGIGTLVSLDRALAQGLERISRHGSTASPFDDLRDEYLLDPAVGYLNHGSIGTIPRVVHEAHRSYLTLCESNPWLYIWGGAWEEPREAVRNKAAHLLGAAADEVAITHNTTEGFNILAQGLPLGPGDEVVFSSLNHPGASVCWEHQATTKGFTVTQFQFPVLDLPRLTRDDVLDLYDRHITPNTRVLVFPHVDNIVGLRHPVQALTELARSRGVEFVAVDGAQAIAMLHVDVRASGVDFYAASPHKWVQAPKGLGLLYVRKELQHVLRPMWVTWGQEGWAGTVRRFEDYGTRNLPELIALGDALDFQEALGGARKEATYRKLWERWRSEVERATYITWRSPIEWSLGASLYAIEVPGVSSPELFDRMFRDHGFVFRAFQTQGLNTARISPNITTTDEEIDRFFKVVGTITR